MRLRSPATNGRGPCSSPEGEDAEDEEEGLGPAEPDDYFLFQRSTRGDLPESQDFRRSWRQRGLRTIGEIVVHPTDPRTRGWSLTAV